MKTTTLVYLFRKYNGADQILLAMKKRGFGTGKVNGPGGKVEAPETIEQAAIRECQEETTITPNKLSFRGIIEFTFENQPTYDNRCHVYTCTDFTGEAQETEEMKPSWYNLKDIPYKQMWDDDEIWVPELLQGQQVHYQFQFTGDGKMISYNKVPAEYLLSTIIIIIIIRIGNFFCYVSSF